MKNCGTIVKGHNKGLMALWAFLSWGIDVDATEKPHLKGMCVSGLLISWKLLPTAVTTQNILDHEGILNFTSRSKQKPNSRKAGFEMTRKFFMFNNLHKFTEYRDL